MQGRRRAAGARRPGGDRGDRVGPAARAGLSLDLKRLFLRVLVASLVAAAALAIGIVLFAEFEETTLDVLITTVLLGAFCLLALPAAVLFDHGRAPWLAYLSMLFAGSAFLVSLLMLWSDSDSEAWWRFLAALVACALAGSQASATTATLRDDDSASVRWLFFAGISAGVLFAVLVCFAAWQTVEESAYYRILAAVGVAAMLVTILQPILRRGGGGRRPATPEARFVAKLDDGREVEVPERVAGAIASLRRDGAEVERIERR